MRLIYNNFNQPTGELVEAKSAWMTSDISASEKQQRDRVGKISHLTTMKGLLKRL
jgi:hypothetical protein